MKSDLLFKLQVNTPVVRIQTFQNYADLKFQSVKGNENAFFRSQKHLKNII